MMSTTVKKWFAGLIGAVINSVASCVTAVIVDPHTFSEWDKLVKLAGVSAIVGAALYLKQHNLPIVEEYGEDL